MWGCRYAGIGETSGQKAWLSDRDFLNLRSIVELRLGSNPSLIIKTARTYLCYDSMIHCGTQ